ncbi:MAG: hypothetical protein K0R57_1243 [Paenibacillaceae bacterium]|nr:hypothetical protein [Paenibacillaceae bacterium]
MASLLLDNIPSPVLLQGNSRIAYRDPAAIYHEGVFRLYYTLVETEDDGAVYLYTAMSESRNLTDWSEPRRLTPRDRNLNYSSPGNIIFHNGRYIMCLQTYPRPNGEKYGNGDSRIWTMDSRDLVHWSEPALLRVKGESVRDGDMGRMIDPYLVQSKEDPGKWWCFYKQNGVSLSYSTDLVHWTYWGCEEAGENVCILQEGDEYILFHSPENGIGVMRSSDLRNWKQQGVLTLGQEQWEWAQGRITAGFVLDGRQIPGVGKYLMFFHGTGPEDERVVFDTHACIGIAWSDDLTQWHWPES